MEEPTALDEQRNGRIGGIVDPRGRAAINPAAIEGMRIALGAHAQLLLDAGTVADCDACFLRGEPVTNFAEVSERLAELDGAFAAAWLDARGVLRLASDPIGHRSIYYAQLGTGELIFASTLHGVLGSGLVARRLAARAVPVFLTFSDLPTEDTLVEGVRVLPPGHRLEFDATRAHLTIKRYWELPGSP